MSKAYVASLGSSSESVLPVRLWVAFPAEFALGDVVRETFLWEQRAGQVDVFIVRSVHRGIVGGLSHEPSGKPPSAKACCVPYREGGRGFPVA